MNKENPLKGKYVVARVSADGNSLEPMGQHGRITVYDDKANADEQCRGLASIFPKGDFVVAPATYFEVGIIMSEIKNG